MTQCQSWSVSVTFLLFLLGIDKFVPGWREAPTACT